MPRPPKSTEILKLTGADKKNPARISARAGEPQPPGPIGEPPVRFRIVEPELGYREAGEKLAIWNECIAMWPWATFSDRVVIEQICDLIYKSRKGTIKAGERSVLRSLVNSVGGDPSGRAKIGMHGAKAPAGAKPPVSDPRSAYLSQRVQ